MTSIRSSPHGSTLAPTPSATWSLTEPRRPNTPDWPSCRSWTSTDSHCTLNYRRPAPPWPSCQRSRRFLRGRSDDLPEAQRHRHPRRERPVPGGFHVPGWHGRPRQLEPRDATDRARHWGHIHHHGGPQPTSGGPRQGALRVREEVYVQPEAAALDARWQRPGDPLAPRRHAGHGDHAALGYPVHRGSGRGPRVARPRRLLRQQGQQPEGRRVKGDAQDFITFTLGALFGGVLMWLLLSGGFAAVRV